MLILRSQCRNFCSTSTRQSANKGPIRNSPHSKFSVPVSCSRGQKERLLKAGLGQCLQQTFGSLLTAKMPSHRGSGCCRRSYLHLENCKDQPIWKRSWLKGPSKAIFFFPKDVDINRTVPENKQAEMKYKCKQRASLLEQIKVLLCLSPHRVSQTHQQHQFFLCPAALALVTVSEAGHSHFVQKGWAIILPMFRLTWRAIIEQKCTFCARIIPGKPCPHCRSWASIHTPGESPRGHTPELLSEHHANLLF